MNPHVAWRFCELEKHLLELWRATAGETRLSGDAIAETARIVNSKM
jgi:hypothetical protein